jgi:glycosyltransferase involved in cell wall biosynthesis
MIPILFMQSQAAYGADSTIHGVLMRYLDRSRFEIHVACTERYPGGAPSDSMLAIREIPDVHFVPVDFGPTLAMRSRKELALDMVKGGAASLASMTALVRYAQRHKIALVHGTEKPRDALYGLFLARMVRAKAITHLHVSYADWMKPFTRWAIRHDDGVIAVSDFVARTAVVGGVKSDRVHRVYNALDLTLWNPDTTDASSVRSEFGVPEDVPLLLIAARVNPWKGFDLVIRALALAAEAGYDFRLLAVGQEDPSATPGGVSYLAELRRLTTDLGLTDRVVFTGFRRDVARIMAASDIFAHPSTEEPFGVVYLEAMAMGKPIVAATNGATPEVLSDGEEALLSAIDDINGLARNIMRLIDDPSLREELGQHGMKKVSAQFTPDRLTRGVELVYDSVLGDR